MVPNFIGFTSIALVSIITVLIAKRWPGVSKIIFVALIIRIIVLLLGHYVIVLPDSTADAKSFEGAAWYIAQNGFSNLLDYYKGPDSRFIAWLIAIPYSLFGRSVLMAKSMTLFFGVGSVFLGWKIANKLWNSNVANKVGWFIALFPSLILYSVLVMREAYICFFLLVAIYGVVNWTKSQNFKSIILAVAGFAAASFFHGASAIGAFTFIIYVGVFSIKESITSLKSFKIKLTHLISLTFFFGLLILYLSDKIYIPYIKDFEFISDPYTYLRKTRLSVMGVAAYPEWTIPRTSFELIYKVPVRAIYFLFSPFPWDVKEVRHLIGLFDAFLYIYLFILILKNFKTIWKNPALRIILLILGSYVMAFAVGVGNFGTGIRHRSKFAIMFILLVAPSIKKLVIKKNRLK